MNGVASQREFKELPLGLIDAPDLPSRSAMDDDKLDELVDSIRLLGLQQPIVVFRDGERFQVIAGHRRRIACERAGLVAAPCFVYPSRDSYTRAIQAHENSRREELSAADEAEWFSDLLEQECNGDIEKLCGLVGEKLSYVDNRLALFRGYPCVFDALKAGKIKLGVAHALNKCSDERWARYYLDAAVRGGATVAIVDGWLIDHKRMFSAPQAPGEPEPAAPSGMHAADVNPFVCELCQRGDHVHLIQTLYVHQHCRLAILDPMLAAYRGES